MFNSYIVYWVLFASSTWKIKLNFRRTFFSVWFFCDNLSHKTKLNHNVMQKIEHNSFRMLCLYEWLKRNDFFLFLFLKSLVYAIIQKLWQCDSQIPYKCRVKWDFFMWWLWWYIAECTFFRWHCCLAKVTSCHLPITYIWGFVYCCGCCCSHLYEE